MGFNPSAAVSQPVRVTDMLGPASVTCGRVLGNHAIYSDASSVQTSALDI
jgi:hypothetical protein